MEHGGVGGGLVGGGSSVFGAVLVAWRWLFGVGDGLPGRQLDGRTSFEGEDVGHREAEKPGTEPRWHQLTTGLAAFDRGDRAPPSRGELGPREEGLCGVGVGEVGHRLGVTNTAINVVFK